MSPPLGYITFSGVASPKGGSYTLSHGITPGVATITMMPQPGFVANVGALELGFGSSTYQFPGCKAESLDRRSSGSGHLWTLKVLDRRWQWEFGEVYGYYNISEADGYHLHPSTIRTPQELATILLLAMGETNFDVSALPNDDYPLVRWMAANPAQELAKLADSLGCRVVLGLDDVVRLWPVGQGATLPDGPIISGGDGLQDAGIPSRLRCVYGPRLFQSRLKLEGVALDTGDEFKKLSDVSYKPEGGWGNSFPEQFWDIADKADRARALKSAFRSFRIVGQAHDPETFKPPGWPESAEQPDDNDTTGEEDPLAVDEAWQLLPLQTDLLATFDQNGKSGPKKPQVTGEYWSGNETYANTDKGTVVDTTFTLDVDKGIVQFSAPVYSLDEDQKTTEPELYLECAYFVRNKKNHMPIRDYWTAPTGAAYETLVKPILREDIQRTIRAVYDDETNQIDNVVDSQSHADSRAQRVVAAALEEFHVETGGTLTYAGLLPVSPDGAIRQVTWSTGEGGATTTASRHTEHDVFLPPYKVRRARERSRDEKPEDGKKDKVFG